MFHRTSLIGHVGRRYFSSAAVRHRNVVLGKAFPGGIADFLNGNPSGVVAAAAVATGFGFPTSLMSGFREKSTLAWGDKREEEEKVAGGATAAAGGGDGKDGKTIVSYWGIPPTKVTKEDGTEWKWTCFRVCPKYIFLAFDLLFFKKKLGFFFVYN